jgi:hypothetical protein
MQMLVSKENYIADESVRRLVKRFVWKSTGEPVKGRVRLGWRQTGDGYVLTGRAARFLNVSLPTLHRWIEGQASRPFKANFEVERLPVICDPLSKRRYVSQSFLMRVAGSHGKEIL